MGSISVLADAGQKNFIAGINMKKILFGLFDILGTIIILCLPTIIGTVVVIAGILIFIGNKLIKIPKRKIVKK